MRVLGVTAPVVTTGCYSAESLAWATTTLSGKAVTLGAETAQGIAVTLAGGQDYAALAIQTGYLKYATAAALPALAAAETAAKQATSGLWGPPCNGTSTSRHRRPHPRRRRPRSRRSRRRPRSPRRADHQARPTPKPDSSVYQKNCAAAEAAGAAPMHVGEPGYRTGLDRDGDGTACDQ